MGMLTNALIGAAGGLGKAVVDKAGRMLEEEQRAKIEEERAKRIEEAAIRSEGRASTREELINERNQAQKTIDAATEREAKYEDEQRKIREANDPKNLSAQKTEAEIAKIKADTGLSEKRAEHVGKGGRDSGDDDTPAEGGMRKKDLIRMEGVDENGHKVVYWKNIKTDKVIKDEPVVTKEEAKAADREAVRKANEATGSKYVNSQEVITKEKPTADWVGNKTGGMLGTSDKEVKEEDLKRKQWLKIYGDSLTKKPTSDKPKTSNKIISIEKVVTNG